MPSCADVAGSPKLAEIPARHYLSRSSLLTHTVRLVLLITTKHALELLLVVVVDVRVSCRRASRSSFVAAEGQRLYRSAEALARCEMRAPAHRAAFPNKGSDGFTVGDKRLLRQLKEEKTSRRVAQKKARFVRDSASRKILASVSTC
jgi:hypothetical protein